jgi:DNA-binding NarL/FixJ family response regulator
MNRPPDRNRSSQSPVKVVIVEDEAWLRENLAREINHTSGLRCVACYRTGEQALQGIPNVQPDVVIMDINLPGMDGVECLRRLKTVVPDLQCLMLTIYEESDKIFNSLLAGASGYLLKRTNTPDLLEAIQQVRGGGSPMSSSIARKVVAYFNQMGENKSETTTLSPREQQVLELLAKGASYKEIAGQLSLSLETIRMNVKHIYAKLHVHSRGEAAAKYMRQPLIRRSESD